MQHTYARYSINNTSYWLLIWNLYVLDLLSPTQWQQFKGFTSAQFLVIRVGWLKYLNIKCGKRLQKLHLVKLKLKLKKTGAPRFDVSQYSLKFDRLD